MITFSAILPNYNDSATLRQALDSLLAQTSPFDEILVIDDGSTDDSRAIISEYAARHPQIRDLPNAQNIGVVATLNRGIGLATGEFIITCSSNDWYDAREVEWCRAALTLYPDAHMVCGNAATFDVAKNKPGQQLIINLKQEVTHYTPESYTRENKRATVYFNGGAIALKRVDALTFGLQRPALKWHADLVLYLQFAYRFPFVYVPELFSTIRLDGERNYSAGRFDWTQQKHVTNEMLRLFREEFPDIGARAKASAMLPKYGFRTLWLIAAQHGWYLTPLLAWRIFMHRCAYWTRHFIPRSALMAIRPYFKV